MLWATKRVSRSEVQSIVDLFLDQVAAFDPYGRMLLVSADETWPMIRLWVAISDPELLVPYYGFRPCTRQNLPFAPVLVAGGPVQFMRIFQ